MSRHYSPNTEASRTSTYQSRLAAASATTSMRVSASASNRSMLRTLPGEALSRLRQGSVEDPATEPGRPFPAGALRQSPRRIAGVLDTAYGAWLDVVLPRVDLVVGLDYPRWFFLQRVFSLDPPVNRGQEESRPRTVAGKTVTRSLTPDQARRYQAWFDNARRLRDLLGELEARSLRAFEDAEG